MQFSEELFTYSLSKALQLEPLAARAIVENLGSAGAFFRLSRAQKEDVLGPHNRLREHLLKADPEADAPEFEQLLREGCRYICHDSADYPDELLVTQDAPIGFFVRSGDTFENIFRRRAIAVVGTRDLSSYGAEWCERIIRSLSECRQQPTIVSGLAYGVDVTAHRTALECGLPTIAVLGTSISNIYPPSHRGIASQIMQTSGCAVISEFGPSLPNAGVSFLQRNRIIAALCTDLLLIESKIKGGGMTTARLASSFNRNVYALPGRIDDTRSQGCNLLISSNVAAPIIGCEELVAALGLSHGARHAAKALKPEEYYAGSMDEKDIALVKKVLALVTAERDISVTGLSRATGTEMGRMLAYVNRLESDGFITMDMFQRCAIKRR